MILGMVILVSLILGVLIFSYNSMVRQQNIRAHHELIGEVAGMLAMTGVGLFAEKIDSSVNSIIMTMAPVLLSSVPTHIHDFGRIFPSNMRSNAKRFRSSSGAAFTSHR